MPGGWRGLILTAIVVFPLSDLLLSLFGNGGSTTISYTEFNNQLNKGNITKIYSKSDATEGVLKNPEPEPDGKKGTYTDFDTQRPVFAGDDLRATLQQQNVVVTAEPVVQQRSFLANLLISLAPMLAPGTRPGAAGPADGRSSSRPPTAARCSTPRCCGPAGSTAGSPSARPTVTVARPVSAAGGMARLWMRRMDLGRLARITPGMTGAELAILVNETALVAVKRKQDEVGRQDPSGALEKVRLGAVRPLVMPQAERERTAYHESGHALLGMLQPGADPVRKITIVPRRRALGVTLSTPDADRYSYTEPYLRGRIIGALGGMAAERVVYGVITTGAESDLEQVTNIARGMAGRWSMSERVGRLTAVPSDPQGAYGLSAAPTTLDAVDEDARRIVAECYDEALRLLNEHRPRLEALAAALLETLAEEQAYRAAGMPRKTIEQA